MRIKRLHLHLILAGIAIGLVVFIVTLKALGTEWLLVNEPLHASVEAVGGLAAILMAIFLTLKRREEYGGKFFLLAMGFLGMGLLDVLHAVSLPGHGFVLLRSVASFVGAFWFALIWVPWRMSERDAVWMRWTPWAVVIGVMLFGIWTREARETLPIMVEARTFTTTAYTVNLLSGVFFMAAATRLLIDFGRIGRPEIYLYACMATFFGLANLMFSLSELWDNTWWFWHLLRLASYLLALGFVIYEHQQTISNLRIALAERTKAEEELRKHRDHLEELVHERTAELRKANKGLQQEITERERMEEEVRKARNELEVRVEERTSELEKANEALNAEIVERKRVQDELATRHRELLTLHRISEITLSAHSLETTFPAIVEEISAATAFPRVAIELYDEARQKMLFKGIKGIPLRLGDGDRILEVPVDETLSGIVARSGQPMVETNAWERPEYAHKVLREQGCRTFVCVPMKDSKGVIGVLSLASPEVIRVDDDFLEMATELANHVASLIERTRAEAWLQSLIDTTQDAVISIDRQGRVVLFNPSAERIFGYTKAEIQGQKVNLLMAEPYASEHGNYIAQYEQTGERRAIGRILTVEARRKNGEIFPIELSITEVTNDESEEVHCAAFIRDVSEKARLQEQFIENSRLAAIGTTAAKFAHEVANPLNGMSLTAQRLERHLAGQPCYSDPAVQSTLRRLRDEIRRLNDLLDDFRSLSRREQYNFQLTALTAIAAEILAMEAENYAGKGVRVEQHLPPDLPLIQADRDRLKQALWNLCKNAVEAMPQGGTLTLHAHSSGADVILEIADTGAGIAPGVDIFEPFTTTKYSGSGLGLVVVRQVVAAHGGNITYSSEPGRGTTFRLVLPQAALEHQLAAP